MERRTLEAFEIRIYGRTEKIGEADK